MVRMERTFALGTIPALAGEPTSRVRPREPKRDYPRARGGTPVFWLPSRRVQGLSPRSRGNLGQAFSLSDFMGTIPALAGEPDYYAGGFHLKRDYPRARGGTVFKESRSDFLPGLSPRSRGNLFNNIMNCQVAGTIPALAGEPLCWRTSFRRIGDYPRARGGTISLTISRPLSPGLSPRSRGNQSQTAPPERTDGTIPALAGEPGRPTPPKA